MLGIGGARVDLSRAIQWLTGPCPAVVENCVPYSTSIRQSQTNVEVTKEEDWNTLLRMEEEYIENICAQIVAFHPDIVITEKGVSDLAQHYLMKADITVRCCFGLTRCVGAQTRSGSPQPMSYGLASLLSV